MDIRQTDQQTDMLTMNDPAQRALVFETFLKCGKLQCKSTFNKKIGMFTDDRTN